MALLVVVLVASWHVCLGAISCPNNEECKIEKRLQSLESFYTTASPVSMGSLLSLHDMGRLLLRGFELGQVQSKDSFPEGRQFYGTGADYTAGYATSYPGYSWYGIGGESTASFNGLDAALSALAFLAFGVWLFNLLLPKLQSAGLGLPGLGKRSYKQEFPVESNSREGFPSDNLLDGIFSTGQELISKIFKTDDSQNTMNIISKLFNSFLFQRLGNNSIVSFLSNIWNVFSQPGKLFINATQDNLPGENKNNLSSPLTPYGESTFNNSNSLPISKFITELFHSVSSSSTKDSRDMNSKTFLENASSEKPSSPSTNPWTSRRKSREIRVGGRSILNDILEGVWKPINYLAQLIQRHHTDHEFPNSRTEISYDEQNANSWESLQYLNDISEKFSQALKKKEVLGDGKQAVFFQKSGRVKNPIYRMRFS